MIQRVNRNAHYTFYIYLNNTKTISREIHIIVTSIPEKYLREIFLYWDVNAMKLQLCVCVSVCLSEKDRGREKVCVF